MDDSARAVPVKELKKAADEIEADFCVRVPVEELKKAADEIEADLSKRPYMIHRFPASLRPLGEPYIRPMCVAIGPYHRGLPQVQEMEDGKRAAAYRFTKTSGRTLEEMHAEIRSVVDAARSLYADDATAGIEDPEFVAMMFHDGCFLLEFMDMLVDGDAYKDPSLLGFLMPIRASLAMDIILLENQLPWLVVKILMSFKSVPLEKFLVVLRDMFKIEHHLDKGTSVDLDDSYQPPHLLALFRSSLTGGDTTRRIPDFFRSVSTSLSATKLEEIGISLTASKTSNFNDMGIKKGLLFGKLFLPPLLLQNSSACCLVNMAVFEKCMASISEEESEESIICSYISVLAMLMDREEDVYELRRKGLLQGDFTDEEVLQFFKSLARHVGAGTSYVRIMFEIKAYRYNRWMYIQFIYNNLKTIVTVFFVIGVLAGIFKTLLDIKEH